MTAGHWDITKSLPGESLMPLSAFSPFVDGLDHPEGVATGPDGTLYAGGEAGQIYRVSLDGSFEEIATTGGFILGLCLDAASNIYACDNGAHQVKKITQAGEVSTWSSGAPDRPMATPNYPVFDAAGNLYVSDSGGWKENNGCIFRVAPDGSTIVFSADVTNFPNGMAMHPGGKKLYSVVSLDFTIVSIEIKEDGTAGAIDTIVELPNNVPDGLAFDEDENLYISCYAPDVIYRVTPAGNLAIVASDWERVVLAAPTNLAFCGPDRRTLAVGSLGRWHLSKATMPVAGARLNYPSL